jgi:hypothetical protein
MRVIASTRGQRKIPVKFFFGIIQDLLVDLAHITWSDNRGLLDYFTQHGRSLLRKQYNVPNWAASKWHHILPHQFKFAWGDTRETQWARKEQGCQNGHPMVKNTVRTTISSKRPRPSSGCHRLSAITPRTQFHL